MRKILLFTDSLGAGGAQRQLVGLASMLHEGGYQVKVCYYHSIDFYKDFLDSSGVKNELIPNASIIYKRIFAIFKYFKREKPDWVIAYQEIPSLIACISKLLGGKYHLIVSERNTTQHIGINEHVRFFLYRLADAIVPNSYSQEEFLRRHYPWMSKNLHTITNFVDLKKFHFVRHDRRIFPEVLVAATIRPSKKHVRAYSSCFNFKSKRFEFSHLMVWIFR